MQLERNITDPLALIQSLVTAGVLGLDRCGQFPVSGHLVHTVNSELADRFLTEAVFLNSYCRAGYKPNMVRISKTNCETDTKICGTKSAEHLRRILYGDFDKLLDEWCNAAITNGWTAPYSLICDLLDKTLDSKPENREALINVTGERGKWIAQLNPRWRTIFESKQLPDDLWENGEHEQRVYFLEKLRLTDPVKARRLLIATWQTEPVDKKLRFLTALKINLSIDDQEFLEQILKDKLKTLRTAAAELLAHIPESSYCARIGERLLKLVKFNAPRKGILLSKKASLEVTLPEPQDKELINDGIEAKQKGKLGPKAVALMQIIAASRLSIWNSAPEDIISASIINEWKVPLLLGLSTAIMRQQNVIWAQAILREFESIYKVLNESQEQINISALMKLGSQAKQEETATKFLKRSNAWHSPVIITILKACEHCWSKEFSSQILNSIQQHFRKNRNPYGNSSLRPFILDVLATRLAPEIAEEVNKPWPGMSDNWNKSDIETVNTLGTFMNFRREMLKELQSER